MSYLEITRSNKIQKSNSESGKILLQQVHINLMRNVTGFSEKFWNKGGVQNNWGSFNVI